MEFVAAVRGSDVKRLRRLALEGRHMNACNKYGESIVHMACRRGDLEVLTFLVSTGAILDVADDFGRTPLHDACWTPEPRFDVVTFLLNKVRVCAWSVCWVWVCRRRCASNSGSVSPCVLS